MPPTTKLPILLASFVLVLGGCTVDRPAASTTAAPAATSSATPSATIAPATTTSAATAPGAPAGPTPSDGHPVVAMLSLPALGVARVVVQPYEGQTDDAPGTAIQDRGLAASPYGPSGGTGPGGVGNYQVTAHRTSSTAAFRNLTSLKEGDVAYVDAEGVRYRYQVTQTRQTSFRSERSLAEQRAPVPGLPDAAATRAMVTLSTCLTSEDHAAGNYWSDEHHNPERRIDKIGVLVSASAPGGGP